ncbi:AAA family ATPase [Candidatus Woesearchaeota archaeon]|nr:AAA family ATPase [Candidatus Woesearchaeota archaeon]
MSLFKDMLKSGESVFRDTVPLNFDFQPKVVFARENEQQRFAIAIRPLFENHNGRNVFVYGPPGVGKTTACKHVLRELEETTDDIIPMYINCWKENSTYKIFFKLCEDLGYKFIQSKKTPELWAMIMQRLNKKSVVFIFDEIDKLEDTDFLYTILEDIYRKSIFLITNYRDSYSEMDERIRSRLNPEFLHFPPYTETEIGKILEQRKEYAFVPGCWDDDAFKEIVEHCSEDKDVRVGLYLMRETGNIAEEKSSRKITCLHVAAAIAKAQEFQIKSKESLEEDLQVILEIIKDNNGKKIGEIFTSYQQMGGELSYKSFQRRILRLQDGRYINTEKVTGTEGNTTIVHFASHKKLTDF